ncbi:hypothetical protein [Psychroserpens mesophilus]
MKEFKKPLNHATFSIKSKHGHFSQRLNSDFLNFLQHLDFTLPEVLNPED